MADNWKIRFKTLDKEGGDLPPMSSTKREIENFKNNRVWIDISNLVLYALASARDELEIMGEAVDRNAISYVQGQCYTIRDLMDLPDTLINSLKTEKEELDEPRDESGK